jgi:hypothetical protein
MDKYNTLIICLSILCIILLIVILSKKQYIERFDANACTFTIGTGTDRDSSYNECLTRCKGESSSMTNEQKLDCNNPVSETSCAKICGLSYQDQCVNPDGTTLCSPNTYLDISGSSKQQCIDRCARTTCTNGACKFFTIDSDIHGRITDKYENKVGDYKKCSLGTNNHKYCGPCVRACEECSNPALCTWITETTESQSDSFLNSTFTLGVMPKNKSALLIWNETLSRSDVSKYVLFVYKKQDNHTPTVTDPSQQTPITVRTINIPFTKVGTNTYTLTGLTNGVAYSISINKISNYRETTSNMRYVKASNTIDIVPSVVTIHNFSGLNKDNKIKQDNLQSQNFMDSIKGKTFDITL